MDRSVIWVAAFLIGFLVAMSTATLVGAIFHLDKDTAQNLFYGICFAAMIPVFVVGEILIKRVQRKQEEQRREQELLRQRQEQCLHSFGGWTLGKRTCTECGYTETCSHKWGQTVEVTNIYDVDETVGYTASCKICGIKITGSMYTKYKIKYED